MRGKGRIMALALALVSALTALLIASTSSPLYATNFWTDTNIYFTIGRGMTQGLMPYTDLFDHKGPLLYMIYALGALVSDASFIGMFLLEVVSLAATLMLAYETVCLFGRGPLCLLAIPVTAVVTATCTAFNQGGSAEEFVLPALALALYTVLRRFEEGRECACPAQLYALWARRWAGFSRSSTRTAVCFSGWRWRRCSMTGVYAAFLRPSARGCGVWRE